MDRYPEEILRRAKAEVVRIQIQRFRHFYNEYFHKNETIPLVEYFFEKVYSLEGKEAWLHLAMNTFQKVKHMIKDTTRENVESLIEVNNLTEELDSAMAHMLLENGWEGETLTLEEYTDYYIELGEEEKRRRQLEIVLHNLKLFYDLAHRPINAILIRPAKFMSQMLGVYPLFKSVEEGYYATLPVPPEIFHAFYEEVEKKEWKFLEDCFAERKKRYPDYEESQKESKNS